MTEEQLVQESASSVDGPATEPQLSEAPATETVPADAHADGESGSAADVPEPRSADTPEPPAPEPTAPEAATSAPADIPAPTPPPIPTPAVIATTAPPTPAAGVTIPTQAAPAADALVPASSDPTRWGRVDPDGTVYLTTSDGERAVGSWQAGAPEEGLAHFARRFDDVLTEYELLAARLAHGGGDPKHTLSSARHLRAGLADAAVVGDVDGLATRVDALIGTAEQAVAAARSARDAQRAEAVAKREALVAEAEQLAAEATQWKQAGDRLKTILDEWRAVRGVDRKTDEALWKRFSKARDTFNRRRGTHFAELDRQRGAAKTRKEELIAQAEAMVESTDWSQTAARYRELTTEWKAVGRTHKDTDDSLWQRFRTAQDAFFKRRSAVFSERDAEFTANAAAKEALLGEAERIDPADADAARSKLRTIQDRWQAIGKVPRERIRELDDRLHAVETKLREAAERRSRRTDPDAEARVAQFRDRVAQFEAQAAKALAAGDTSRAEQAQSQAAQWREWLATAEESARQL